VLKGTLLFAVLPIPHNFAGSHHDHVDLGLVERVLNLVVPPLTGTDVLEIALVATPSVCRELASVSANFLASAEYEMKTSGMWSPLIWYAIRIEPKPKHSTAALRRFANLVSSSKHNQSNVRRFPAKLLPLYKTAAANIVLQWQRIHSPGVASTATHSHAVLPLGRTSSEDRARARGVGHTPTWNARRSVCHKRAMLPFANETRSVAGRVGRIEFGEIFQCTRVRFHLPIFLFFHGAPVRDAPNSSSCGAPSRSMVAFV
jgi:hypothetical protein